MPFDCQSHDGLLELSLAHRAQPGDMFRQIFQVRSAVENVNTNQGGVRNITAREKESNREQGRDGLGSSRGDRRSTDFATFSVCSRAHFSAVCRASTRSNTWLSAILNISSHSSRLFFTLSALDQATIQIVPPAPFHIVLPRIAALLLASLALIALVALESTSAN